MTVPLSICTSCRASIPRGELYCPNCGASSPTEGVEPVIGATRVERASEPGIDLVARRTEVQAALGANFEVKSLIGRGGFGEVWSALDVQLGRDVAVKVLRPEVGNDPNFRKRFRREARAVARLRHPGIVPIYHVGESGGMVWFIMPLVEGVTLRAALAVPGGISRDEAVRILIEASASLGEAHARGIVHRDIKPENIMLEGPQRRVLLMDFGVAKLEGPTEAESNTEADVVLGSPEYMSPEQATARPLDARSDIYSLGVVAYRMLAGRLPFEGDTPREMLAHHVLTPPSRLQDHAPVRAALADAVMRCLAKTPDKRWQTAAEFARALASAAPSASFPAVSPVRPLWGRLERRFPILARRYAAATSGLVLVVVLAAAVLWPLAWLRQRREWTSAAAAISLMYRHGADSLGLVGTAFARGDVTGPQFANAREDVMAGIEAGIEDRFSAAVDDSSRWPEAARHSVSDGARQLESAGASVRTFTLRPSDVAGCRLVNVGDALRLSDDAPRTNCWFAAGAGGPLTTPLEYFARFRILARVRAGAGVGLAWCRAGECRIAFVWPAAPAVWGAHRPHGGLSALALGRRVALAPGDHELRVRWQGGGVRCRLDGALVLERSAGADSTFMQRPDSVAFVVQNTRVELEGPNAIAAVSAGRPIAQP